MRASRLSIVSRSVVNCVVSMSSRRSLNACFPKNWAITVNKMLLVRVTYNVFVTPYVRSHASPSSCFHSSRTPIQWETCTSAH